ncbi:hypothetical protein J18TS1_26120 [Oceanobacillus oncorhynchi subsp. incaldanensis]|uniref:DUF4282 domain-containing protein n=2 Tax=Oceanobacillus TaxID=182709 RepID=A0A0A1MPX1_9BACI|nr:DUF4282 domain-containing protein [Oceanobacillus oncorhynchi]MDM8102187.1 DUF4282 domain-containing protein [Oceanobacillus oncorhynchi]UUI40253.1 DUF4282 domain-containing protein [Oceanobacillus oncorhynchi]GIO19512.1 hypothetical protein J18TS1_26120 [Oceanobacillus oncorhynchi subsp. incaldanensis]CEI81672.1 hypothetical protein BN997_01507 [Oceanobacillus oncorhynchi]
MNKFFSFEEMITPIIIKVLFWVGLAASVIFGLITIFTGIIEEEFLLIFSGLLTIVIGSLLVRVYCELLIIMFKIYETLKQIRDK